MHTTDSLISVQFLQHICHGHSLSQIFKSQYIIESFSRLSSVQMFHGAFLLGHLLDLNDAFGTFKPYFIDFLFDSQSYLYCFILL